MNNRRLLAGILIRCALGALVGLLAVPGSAQTNNGAVLSDGPEAIYEGARVEQNVTVEKVNGMQIHTRFTVEKGLNIPCMIIAYFYYDDAAPSPTPLKSDDPNYRDITGAVSTRAHFTPAYDPAVYKDLQLFIPYSALRSESGKEYQLKFYLALYDTDTKKFFYKSGWYKFVLNAP